MSLIRHPGSGSEPEHRSVWRVLLPAAVGLVLATPVVTWWLVGPLNTAPARIGLDYAFRPWPISPAMARAAGITAAVLARWWAVLLPLLAAGFIAGAGWRVMTAGVLGSNIGAGFVVLFGGPLVAILVAWALGYSFHLARQDRRTLPSGRRASHPERMLWAALLAMVALCSVAVWR